MTDNPWKFPPELPRCGKYVLIHLNNDNWIDEGDYNGAYFQVAKRVKDDYKEENNDFSYSWETFGPDSHFGQDVDAWMEIPKGAPRKRRPKREKHHPMTDEEAKMFWEAIKPFWPKDDADS